MARWVLRRAAAGLLVLWLVATVTFVLVSLAPGDISHRISDPRVPPAARERWAQQFGLDQPWPVRYGAWLAAAGQGDLGHSWVSFQPVTMLLLGTLPATILLAGLGLAAELAGGIALALVQIRRPDGLADRMITVSTIIAYALPSFWVALMLVFLFAFTFPLFPPSHMLSPAGELATGWPRVLDLARHTVLPVTAIAITGMGAVARYLRGSLLDEQASHYLLAARARGCSQGRALVHHALPNALPPLVTMVGLSLPFLVSGSLVVEVVFSWPGMGRLMFDAALARDVPLLMGGTVLATAAVVVGSALADLTYAAIDPRVRR